MASQSPYAQCLRACNRTRSPHGPLLRSLSRPPRHHHSGSRWSGAPARMSRAAAWQKKNKKNHYVKCGLAADDTSSPCGHCWACTQSQHGLLAYTSHKQARHIQGIHQYMLTKLDTIIVTDFAEHNQSIGIARQPPGLTSKKEGKQMNRIPYQARVAASSSESGWESATLKHCTETHAISLIAKP